LTLSPVRRWLIFAALSLTYFVVSAGAFSSLGVVLPAMVGEMHWSWKQAGLGYTLLGLACGLASYLPAILIRRFGVRGAILAGMIVMVGGFGAMAMAHSIWLYWAATVLIGIAFALVSTVPGSHVLTDLFKRRATALGAYFTIGASGGVAGPIYYLGIHAAAHGWRPYWIGFVVISLLVGLFALVVAPGRREDAADAPVPLAADVSEKAGPEKAGPEPTGGWTVRGALATPQFYLIVAGYSVYLLVNSTTHGFAVQHLIERGVSQTDAASMLSIEALVGAAVGLFGGMLGEKVSAKTLMVVSLAAATVGSFALAEARGWPLMTLYILGVGIGFGLSFVAAALLLFEYFGKRANLELFSLMCLLSTIAAFGPFVGGWMRDATGSFWGVLMGLGGVTGAVLVASLFLQPPSLRQAPQMAQPREAAL